MNHSKASDLEIKTDVADLEKIINLPVRPLAVEWTLEVFDNSKNSVPAPSDRRLVVLMKFDEQSAAEFTSKISPEASETALGSTEIKDWFPEAIKKLAQTKHGKIFLEGAKFPVDAFQRPPYQSGKLIRAGASNYFVLHLFSF